MTIEMDDDVQRIAAADATWAFDVQADASWDVTVPDWRQRVAAVGAATTDILSQTLADAGVASATEIALVLADDATIRDLNRDWRDQDSATNVLSFATWWDDDCPPPPAADLPVMLGDIAVARQTLVVEAERDGQTVGDHFSHLLLHGVLHLLGFDHQDPEDADDMESLEIELLAGLGIANPYLETEHNGESGDE